MKPLALLLATALLLNAADPIRGFPPSQWTAQRDLEHKAQAIPSPDRIRAYLERMSREPHHAGSPASRAVAESACSVNSASMPTSKSSKRSFLTPPRAAST